MFEGVQRIIDFLSTLAAIMVIPAAIFSFSRVTKREEFRALRESGQKLNLNMHNLISGYRRAPDDPLRSTHIKLARIGFLHWLLIPIGFVSILMATAMAIFW